MIKNEYKDSIGELMNGLFLSWMSLFIDIDKIEPCETAECRITDEEVELIPDAFMMLSFTYEIETLLQAGDPKFIKKKVVQLIKIAKSDNIIPLDLYSELLFMLIATNCSRLFRFDECKNVKIETPFPGKEKLLEEIAEEDYEEWEEASRTFPTFIEKVIYSNKILLRLDSSFFLEHGVFGGIFALYLVTGNYDREFHMRPWTDIGEEVPAPVYKAFDAVEERAEGFGGLDEMRAAQIREFREHVFGISDKYMN